MVRALLVAVGQLDQSSFVKGAAQKFHTYRQAIAGESGGHRNRREAGERAQTVVGSGGLTLPITPAACVDVG